MISPIDPSGGMALDVNGLNDLKRAAKDNSPEAIKATAKQFEAMFMNMMLKSMRDATPQDGPLDSEQSRSFTAMLDQQMSQNLAGKGLGLADVLVKQLSKPPIGSTDASTSKTSVAKNTSSVSAYEAVASMVQPASLNASTSKIKALTANLASSDNENLEGLDLRTLIPPSSNQDGQKVQGSNRKAFQQNMATAAQEASLASGIPAQYLIGQAALESGWGQHEIKGVDGAQSFNLFGIKASSGWKGKVVSATTTEYVNGNKQMRVEKFRAYDSYADSFKDFANLIRSNSRYSNVVGNGQDINEYAQSIQKAGYATDPQYAIKLSHTIQLANAN
jgi:flagellar protein FlgJ